VQGSKNSARRAACVPVPEFSMMAMSSDRSASRVEAPAERAEPLGDAILRSIRLPLVVLDLEMHVVSTNDAFHRAFPSSSADASGGVWATPALRELLRRVVHERVGALDCELEHLGRHLHVDAQLLAREDEELILLTLEDVTELHEARTLAASRDADLEQEHRHKDEFLAMLGHELRNPLAALVNGLSLLEHVGCDAQQFEKIHPMLVRQTRRMTVMLDQLLDISRVSSGRVLLDLRPVDLVDVARTAVEAVQPMIDAGKHQLVLSVPEKRAVVVHGDAVRLVQVLENLLSNAVKYTNEGGTIWLTVAADHDFAQIRVRDTGVGIEPELLPHIFDVFIQGAQSLDRAKGGLGLGLALVRQLVEMHNGRVEAFSPGPACGSEFVVELPRLHTQPLVRRRSEPKRDSARALTAGGLRPSSSTYADSVQQAGLHPLRLRVLVVDDEQDAALTLAELLQSYGHDTRVAYDGCAAVETAFSFAPDVVLLDLGLPDIDGYEVAKRIRTQGKAGIRLIAVTGYQRDDARLRAAGFDDHVIKPRCLDRLSSLLAKS
jgi:two-component system CheB/CheR fusion protein